MVDDAQWPTLKALLVRRGPWNMVRIAEDYGHRPVLYKFRGVIRLLFNPEEIQVELRNILCWRVLYNVNEFLNHRHELFTDNLKIFATHRNVRRVHEFLIR